MIEINPTNIACTFSTLLREAVGDNIDAINKMNQSDPDARWCASHDYVDANMIMQEAGEYNGVDFSEIIGTKFGEDMFNLAWEIAYETQFNITA